MNIIEKKKGQIHVPVAKACVCRSSRASSPEPGAPDGGERIGDRQHSLIRNELVSQTTKLLSESHLGPLIMQPRMGLRSDLQRAGTGITWQPAVKGDCLIHTLLYMRY